MPKFEVVTDEHRKNKTAILPTRSTQHSAGYDFAVDFEIKLQPKSYTELMFTDIKAKMNDDEVLMLYIRSSLGIKSGITLANNTGIIDSDYYSNPNNDGNIGVKLYNNSNNEVTIPAGKPFMQGIFVKYITTDDDKTTSIRDGGFGSTDNKEAA